jgi:hypothetical protein
MILTHHIFKYLSMNTIKNLGLVVFLPNENSSLWRLNM